MSDDTHPTLSATIARLLGRLVALASTDTELAQDLRALGEQLVARFPPPTAPSIPVDVAPPVASPAETPIEVPSAPSGLSAPPATFAQESSPRQPPCHSAELTQVADDDLPIIARRCEIKAQAARARATWVRETGGDETGPPLDLRTLIAEARKLPDTYLWMADRFRLTEATSADLSELADSFDALAEALTWIADLNAIDAGRIPNDWAAALFAAAEAQASLRLATRAVGYEYDRDQLRAFHWLRATGRNDNIYLRHLSKDDPPDLGDIPSLRARILEARASLTRSQQRARDHDQLLNRIRYHARRIPLDDEPTYLGATGDQEWLGLDRALEAWTEARMPPSNIDLRGLLAPLAPVLPDAMQWSDGADLVWREVFEYLARETEQADTEAVRREAPAHVGEAAALIRGRTLVLIGGVPRADAEARLKRAFELKDLVWIETRAHQSTAPFEPIIGRPDVVAVLLAIRWASHGFAEIDTQCARLGKPLVRLPRGYNPSEVARQILAQASGKLGVRG